MTTAICAWLRRRGVSVAPFKAQNMSNHSYPCKGGGEIGRAQVAQAEACRLDPEPAMNPILLKPNGNGTSQVILHGKVWKTLPPREYYKHFPYLFTEVIAAYEDLARRFDVVVIEGAGSVSELNLRSRDLVNLNLATRVGARWLLVADIERGGVFGSVLGTVSLLTPEERRSLLGFAVNKFRGDRSLFDDGRTILESKSGVPCLGVFPYAEDLTLDAEDSLALEPRVRTPSPAGASIAIIRFPRLSNGTDLRLLKWADWVVTPPTTDYDFVILPGTKDTMSDLAWMRERGLDEWVHQQHRRGATVIGICGGYQMLGQEIRDPDGVESIPGTARGLGLLPVQTVLVREKTTTLRRASIAGRTPFAAYEIHLGVTSGNASLPPFAQLEDGTPEGMRGDRVLGTYLHGALEDADVCTELFGVGVAAGMSKDAEYAGLADWFEGYAERPEEWLR